MDAVTTKAIGAYNDALRRGLSNPIGDADTAEAPTPVESASFGSVLGTMMQDAVKTQAKAEQAGLAAAAGKANVTDVVTALTNAEVTLNTVVAVRDKVVQAYQEIMRMPI